MPRPAVSLDIHIPGSGSAKAGTNAERHTCKLRILAGSFLRAPHKRASGEVRFLLTKTYMDVGDPDIENGERPSTQSRPEPSAPLFRNQTYRALTK